MLKQNLTSKTKSKVMTEKEYEFDCKLQDIIDEIYRANELNRLGKHSLLDEAKIFLQQQIKEIIEL